MSDAHGRYSKKRALWGVGVAIAATAASGRASAEPLRLRGDALAQTPSPAGLLVLQGSEARRPWVSAEALAWLGTGDAGTTGDVLTVVLKVKDPKGRADSRVGRMLVSAGAVRPLHLDGVDATARAPWGTSLQLFGGVPVVPRLGDRAYDWAVGGRASQSILDRATLGVGYVQRRDRGVIADQEIGADFASAPSRYFDLAARTAYDLSTEGLADALVSVGSRIGGLRLEGFATRRSPSRLLPATSLFATLGDAPHTRVGADARLRPAPRLDVGLSGAGQIQEGRSGYDGAARATLRTDDDGVGALGLELRRTGLPGASWTGARGFATVPIALGLRAATELEIAAPDDPRGRGAVWPWALVALAWRGKSGWDVAGALEASARPAVSREVAALLRASYEWGR
jgi:hypothetical protein